MTNLGREVRAGAVEERAKSGRMSGENRRHQLIEVAIQLFSRKGFRGTTTKEIAAAAYVNEAIIFRHFPTKEDLYAAILDYKCSTLNTDQWIQELRVYAEAKDDEGLFLAVASRILEHHRCDGDFLRLMLYSALEGHELARNFMEREAKPLHAFLGEYIATRQREGVFGPGSPAACVHAFIGMISHHVLMTRLFKLDNYKLTDEERARSCVKIFLNGLCADPASEKRT